MGENKRKRTETFASIFGDEYDEIVEGNKDNNGTIILNINTLIPFENHPFKLYEGDRLDDMVESIKNFGIIVPIVVRKKDNKYQILSGHNRANSAKIVGLSEVPAIIKENLTEEEATLIVTETNLMQRSFTDLLHSERATVIATRHNAMKRQGIRTFLFNIDVLDFSDDIKEKMNALKEIIQMKDNYSKAILTGKGGYKDDK